jgi:hypothetical protein
VSAHVVTHCADAVGADIASHRKLIALRLVISGLPAVAGTMQLGQQDWAEAERLRGDGGIDLLDRDEGVPSNDSCC